jgi:hypothetical protein
MSTYSHKLQQNIVRLRKLDAAQTNFEKKILRIIKRMYPVGSSITVVIGKGTIHGTVERHGYGKYADEISILNVMTRKSRQTSLFYPCQNSYVGGRL